MMIKKTLLFLLCLAVATACDDFFETNLSSRKVQVIAPVSNAQVTAGRVAFRWNHLEGSAGYRFVLVAPSFEAADYMVADTLILVDSLSRSYGCTQILAAGEYAWSVSAFNSGYETLPEIRVLSVLPLEETPEPEEPDQP